MGEKTQKIQEYKTQGVSRMKKVIENTKNIIFTDYRGLSVRQITELRRNLSEKETEYKVIKNSFVKIALKELNISYDEDFLFDPTALALVNKDVSPIAKILCDFSKNSHLRVKGGMIDGKMASPSEIEAISKLPGQEQLYAMLMGTLNAPLTNLVYIMNGVASKLVRTLQAVADKKQ